MKKKQLTASEHIQRDLDADWSYDINVTPDTSIWY